MYKLIKAFDEYLENVKKRYPEITKELVYYDENSADAKRMGEELEKYQGEMWGDPILKFRKSELNKIMENVAASASLRSLIRLCYKNTKKKEFVVLFNDGTKETTKYDNEKDFTPYVGFALCVVKKIFGSNTAFHNEVNKFYKTEEKKDGDGK